MVDVAEEIDLKPQTPFTRLRARLGPAPTYEWTRFAILRLTGLVYLVAFSSIVAQGPALFGSRGLTPTAPHARAALEALGTWSAFWREPSLFWLTGASDRVLFSAAWLGTALALGVTLGLANVLAMATLWALYMSFVHVVPAPWYGYGWEIQLVETGFLAIFLVPLLDARPFPTRRAPAPVIWLYRWLIFRIMLGAGLIKLRGDPCWRDFTCLRYHYETQPNPNPLSRTLHFMPHWFHVLGVLFNHLCELVCPWFVFGPRRARHVTGALLLAFQVSLIVSGNLSWLNWLTIVPILACFDDSVLSRLVQRGWRPPIAVAGPTRTRRAAVWTLVALVALLSTDPVANLFSSKQAMNRSFDPFELVNTYGAFGTVGRERFEVVLSGTRDETPGSQTVWQEYELKCKPGDPTRAPCVITPYHYRLDWQIWFAAFPWASYQTEPWTVHLVWKLLHNDPRTLGLLAKNPFPGPPPALDPCGPVPLRVRATRGRALVAAPPGAPLAPATPGGRSPPRRLLT